MLFMEVKIQYVKLNFHECIQNEGGIRDETFQSQQTSLGQIAGTRYIYLRIKILYGA